jgi:membrane fusion protein, heavy metal efflux system
MFIRNVVDADAFRSKVRIALPNPDRRLKPNMSANATFFAPKQTVTVVPTTALIPKNKTDEVLIEVEQWTLNCALSRSIFSKVTKPS